MSEVRFENREGADALVVETRKDIYHAFFHWGGEFSYSKNYRWLGQNCPNTPAGRALLAAVGAVGPLIRRYQVSRDDVQWWDVVMACRACKGVSGHRHD